MLPLINYLNHKKELLLSKNNIIIKNDDNIIFIELEKIVIISACTGDNAIMNLYLSSYPLIQKISKKQEEQDQIFIYLSGFMKEIMIYLLDYNS